MDKKQSDEIEMAISPSNYRKALRQPNQIFWPKIPTPYFFTVTFTKPS